MAPQNAQCPAAFVCPFQVIAESWSVSTAYHCLPSLLRCPPWSLCYWNSVISRVRIPRSPPFLRFSCQSRRSDQDGHGDCANEPSW